MTSETPAQVWLSCREWLSKDPGRVRMTLARALFLRSLERNHYLARSVKSCLGGVRTLAGLLVIGRKMIPFNTPDVWLVADAPTASILGTARVLAEWLTDGGSDDGLRVGLLAGDRRWMRTSVESVPCMVVFADDLAGLLPRVERLRRARHAWREAGRALSDAPVPVRMTDKIRLLTEAAAGAIRCSALESWNAWTNARLALSASEYFSLGVAAREVMQRTGGRWVTVQHGAVNLTYAPWWADEYWVWDEEAGAALACIGDHVDRIRVMGPVRRQRERDTGESGSRMRSRLGIPEGVPVLVFFSQGHGPEHPALAHEALARQLHQLVMRIRSVRLVVKLHPSETASPYHRFLRATPHTVFVGTELEAHDIMAIASCCVAFDSTALLEATMQGIPTLSVQAGEPFVVQRVASESVQVDDVADALERILVREGTSNVVRTLRARTGTRPSDEVRCTRSRCVARVKELLAQG